MKASKPKISIKKGEPKYRGLDDFLDGATVNPLESEKPAKKTIPAKPKVVSVKREKLPWEGKEFSKTLKAFMNFSLDQEYIEKLRWVSKQTDQGQQKIIRLLLKPFLDTEIERILKK